MAGDYCESMIQLCFWSGRIDKQYIEPEKTEDREKHKNNIGNDASCTDTQAKALAVSENNIEFVEMGKAAGAYIRLVQNI